MIRELNHLIENWTVRYILLGIFVFALNIALTDSMAMAKKVRFTSKIPKAYKSLLSGIGSLKIGSNYHCTAFCVSASTIATAQHCVLTKNERWKSSTLSIRFSLEVQGKRKTSKIMGRSTAERRANVAYGLKSGPIRSTLYTSKKRNRKALESDWALIKLEHNICSDPLPLSDLIGLKFRTRGKDFAVAISAEKFNARKRGNRWTFRGKCKFIENLYSGAEALIAHDCEGRPGTSGAPFLLRDDEGSLGVVALDAGHATTRKKRRRIGTATKVSSFVEALEHFDTHRRVSSSGDIMKMQEILKMRGLLDGKADGVFGRKTRWALVKLEGSIGLPELGIPTILLYEILTESREVPWKCETRGIRPPNCRRIGLDD